MSVIFILLLDLDLGEGNALLADERTGQYVAVGPDDR
jgi:hypothetical protein